MGCGSSKQRKRCQRCSSPYSPVARSYTMHVLHPPQQKGDNFHVVALTSTTLGSLVLDSSSNYKAKVDTNSASDIFAEKSSDENNPIVCDDQNRVAYDYKANKIKEFSVGLIEGKTWSNMTLDKIQQTVLKTPMRTPPEETETINTWELMAGLQEEEEEEDDDDSFSLHVSRDPGLVREGDTDTNVIKDYDKGRKKKKKQQLVVYFTSLRGVRKTYEDCCHVRVILKGLGVRIDERDVSMHSGFKEELKELLAEGFRGGCLPRVFVGREYIGGAEEIRRLHEEGQLRKVVEGCEMRKDDDDNGGGGGVCKACGDIRFVLCETCNGSCKIYYDDEEGEEEEVEEESGFRRCPDCNENGLIRCRICCN